jgi:hypothetical protein
VKVVEKWSRKPLFVSFDTVPTPIWDIPFPAVTVCNVQKVNKKMVRRYFLAPACLEAERPDEKTPKI